MPPLATTPKCDVTIVVPVYGGYAALAELYERLSASMINAGLTWELILVDDRGRPESWAAIRALAQTFPEVTGLRLSKNFGQHAATICGIEHACGNWIITMDDLDGFCG